MARLTFRRPYIPPRTIRPQTFQMSEPSFTPLYFSASSGPRSPSAGGNMVQVRIRNPLGSGMALVVYKVTLFSLAVRDVQAIMLSGPNSADLATTITVASRKLPPETSAGRASTTNANLAISGSSILWRHPVEGNTPWTWDAGGSIILRPDMVFEVRWTDLNNGTVDSFDTDIDWYEIADTVLT